MRFSSSYPKLRDKVFTTVRAGEAYYRPGMRIACEAPEETFTAEILFDVVTSLAELPLPFLRYDVGEQLLSRKEIVGIFQSFYKDPKPDPNGDWTLYICRRIGEPDSKDHPGGKT